MVQWEISNANTLTIRLGATPSGIISNSPPSSPTFTPDALPVTTLPVYPGLEQAPNMLACIPNDKPINHTTPQPPMPEENFWTLWCNGKLTEADTLTIRLDTTPSGLTSAHLHHPPPFFTGRMPFLLPNQQCQSIEEN